MKSAAAILFALLLFACAAWLYIHNPDRISPDVANPQAKSVRSVTDVKVSAPAYIPPVLSSPQLSNFTNKSLSLDQRFPSDSLSTLARVETPEDFAGLVAVLTDASDVDSVRNEAANILARSKSHELLPALLRVLKNPQEGSRFRAFATQHLGAFLTASSLDQRTEASEYLAQLLFDKDVEVRREAVLALVLQKDPIAERLVIEWLQGNSPETASVRDLAIRCITEMNRREFLPRIRELAANGEENARVAAVNTLALWNDDSSRIILETASKDSSERIRKAAQLALKRMDSLERLIPPQEQTVEALAQALRHNRLQIRNEAAVALLRYKEHALPALPALTDALQRLEPECTTGHIVAYLDVLRNLQTRARSAAPALAELMNERARIYSNRKKPEVHRLRSYILLALSDVGDVENSLQFMAEFLANSDNEMVFNYAAAARASGKLESHGGPLVPLLMRSLNDEFSDAAITLESYHAPITPQNKTCAKLESIRALARMGTTASAALPVLEKWVASEFKPVRNLPDIRTEARSAIAAIRGVSGF